MTRVLVGPSSKGMYGADRMLLTVLDSLASSTPGRLTILGGRPPAGAGAGGRAGLQAELGVAEP
jgi:hypothetical protein